MDKILEACFKKVIHFNSRGKDLKFKVSQNLFSSHDIDVGTKRLLRTFIFENLDNYHKVLDLGCGYGPIGIALKSANKSAKVHMVDVDALALAYSQINSELNKVSDIKIYASLGYNNVRTQGFDLITSNIPAKVGKNVLSDMLTGGRHLLSPEGRMTIVVIDAIYKDVEKILSDSNVEILYHKNWPGHQVLHYKFLDSQKKLKPPKSAWEKGEYVRNIVRINNPKPLDFTIQTTHNLPEFDTPSYDTNLILENLKLVKDRVKKTLFFNPGQGYLPVALAKLKGVSQIDLVDRNLQSLMTSKNNLIRNNYPSESTSTLHQVGLAPLKKKNYNFLVGVIDEKENQEVLKILVEQASSLINDGGMGLFASSSTTITRMTKHIRKIESLEIQKREKSKGRSLLVIKKHPRFSK